MLKRSLPIIPHFSNSALAVGGFGEVRLGLGGRPGGLAVGGRIQTSGLATGGQVSYIAAHYSVTPSHIAFNPLLVFLSNPHPLVLHYLC